MSSTRLELRWPIKRSFIRYVARMDDGQVLGGHGLTMLDASTFVFPADEARDRDDVFPFRGELRLQAHNGALAVRIANPVVALHGSRGELSIENPEGEGARLRMVTFTASSSDADGHTTWTGTDVRLTVDAAALFGGYYGEDEAFDDLTIVASAQ